MALVPSESDQFLVTLMDVNPGDDRDLVKAKESLWKALDDLPEELKTVILLRQQMDLSFVDVADRMQRNLETVQDLWRQAIIVLGEKLETGG